MSKELERISGFARIEIRALKSSLSDNMVRNLRPTLSQIKEHKDIYNLITGHVNSEDSLNLIRLCAPIVYSATAENLSVSVETWKKKVIAIDYGAGEDESNYDDVVRLFISPLEITFKLAPPNELRAIIAFLVDDTKKLQRFDLLKWKHDIHEDARCVA